MKFEDRADALVWTSLLHSYHMGLGKALKSSGFKRFVWCTSIKDNQCVVCKAMNGIELSAEEVEHVFPAHPRCSCFMIPKM